MIQIRVGGLYKLSDGSVWRCIRVEVQHYLNLSDAMRLEVVSKLPGARYSPMYAFSHNGKLIGPAKVEYVSKEIQP